MSPPVNGPNRGEEAEDEWHREHQQADAIARSADVVRRAMAAEEAILQGKADAALAASIFHFGEFTIEETKQIMAQRGIPVRLTQERSKSRRVEESKSPI